MPRQARVIVPGFPHHIVQRGRNRQPVFVERRDFEYYLANRQEWKQVYELNVFSYCLMTNHVHLVVQANDNVTAIPQLMGKPGRENRDRFILCTLVFCLGLSLSKTVFSNPLGLLFF